MRRVDGAKVTRLTPGELLVCPVLAMPQGVVKGGQKSAEVILAVSHDGEGPNRRNGTGTERSMVEGGADKKAEKLERTRRVGGGTAEGKGSARQTGTARDGYAEDGVPPFM